ncbi:flagellin [Kushneria sp. TE3]|uniref:flagellin N-terminal helical domain-containing protein n=1 Tax=Kushneria sp. TE3 TaxID=3449832 RepID=UPI003F688B12
MITVSYTPSRLANNQLDKTQRSLNQAIERLSSGLRVNSAKDDAAGLAIGNRMEAQVRGTEQARRNTNDGASMSLTAEGALSQVNDHLQRIRELTVQGLNGTLKLVDQDAIQQEINLNLKEIDRLNTQSQFNGINLLDGSAGTVNVQVGANDGETLGVDLNRPGFSVEELGLTDFTVAGISGEVTDINIVTGRARDIAVNAGDFALPAGYSNPQLMQASTNTAGYPASWYTRAQDGDGNTVYFAASVDAVHDTDTDTSRVRIGIGQQLYAPVTSHQEYQIEDVDSVFRDRQGGALEGDNQLVKTGSQHSIKSGSGPEATYYPARVTTSPAAIDARIADNEAVWPPSPAATIDGVSFNNEDVDYFDSTGQTVNGATLSRAGDNYYLTAPDGAFYSATVESTPDGHIVRAGSEQPASAPATQPVTEVDGQSIDDARHRYLDANGNTGSFQEATLTQSEDGQYYLEQGGRYYAVAPESVAASRPQVIATATTDTPIISPERAITTERNTVDGTSTITLDPRNVTASYTDRDGRRIEDALRVDDNGQYFLRAASGNDDTTGYRSATLVNTEEMGTLLKTRTGSGDLIIYYRMSTRATTDVPNARSTVELTEVNPEIRLRTPDDPLAALDRAIARVDDKRSVLGATQNRMSAIIDQQGETIGALSEARSQIMDADYAVETANMSRAQITQQAGTAVLAQANQRLDSVLALLR